MAVFPRLLYAVASDCQCGRERAVGGHPSQLQAMVLLECLQECRTVWCWLYVVDTIISLLRTAAKFRTYMLRSECHGRGLRDLRTCQHNELSISQRSQARRYPRHNTGWLVLRRRLKAPSYESPQGGVLTGSESTVQEPKPTSVHETVMYNAIGCTCSWLMTR